MNIDRRSILATLAFCLVPVAGCSAAAAFAPGADVPRATVEARRPATVLGGQVTLTPRAAERIGLETTPVRTESLYGNDKVVPFAAVIWSPDGQAWAYTSTQPLVFVRIPLSIARITDQDDAVLTAGPPLGTLVVTQGATELYGAELGVGGED